MEDSSAAWRHTPAGIQPSFHVVQLSWPQLSRMVGLAASVLPREACGLLGGRPARGGRLQVTLYPAENEARSARGFLIRSRQMGELQRRIEDDGLVLCGCYHSHPRGAARPSVADRRLSARPGFLWIIFAPARLSIKAFWWNGRRFMERPLRIEP